MIYADEASSNAQYAIENNRNVASSMIPRIDRWIEFNSKEGYRGAHWFCDANTTSGMTCSFICSHYESLGYTVKKSVEGGVICFTFLWADE